MKKIISLLCSLTIITGAGAAFCTSAVDATAESTETPDKTPVGTVSLLFNSSDDTNSLDSKMIYKDGQFDMTWNVADSGINEANNITLSIENIHPNPLGLKDELELKIDEIWVDGEKLDVTLHGKPAYAIMTDNIYTSDEIVRYIYPLKQTYINNSDDSFNDLGTSIDDEVRIVFTMNGLIDPDTYRDEHPGRPPMPAPPSVSSTTTTTTTTTTTEAAATTTTTAKTTAAPKTTAKQSANNPPKTGDAGIAGILLAGAGAVAMAFVMKKQKD
ncbi:MAG: LPXTG cell wall anchor domain-containing protein [Ruminococcus sp.]|nr:LPXTG cell wall anchor domain-containing protein [Ruminococcus sp.]